MSEYKYKLGNPLINSIIFIIALGEGLKLLNEMTKEGAIA